VLYPLTDDPEPTLEYEEHYGGSSMDPATMSINTVRGRAMHAVLDYALWVRQRIERAGNAKDRLTQGFGEMPEVRGVLDRHLDPQHDPSLAIRAVYGQRFPWLVMLDPPWAAQSVATIFPLGDVHHDLCDAAWQAYITFCDPYDDVFELLRDQYSRAVERIATMPTHEWPLADPDQRLATHLMAFYQREKLGLNESEGLLADFYARASDSLRGHALGIAGTSLRTKEVPPQVLARLLTLWKRRLEAARSAKPDTPHAAELAAFGSWFVVGKLDDIWAIEQLKEALA
jgi:hypothetical protein